MILLETLIDDSKESHTSLRLILCSLLQIPTLFKNDFSDFLIRKCLILTQKLDYNDVISDIMELCLYNTFDSKQRFQSNSAQIMIAFNGK